MSMEFLQDARLFLVASMKGQINTYESIHPWRKDWKYVVTHSLRVEQTVLQILDREPYTLTENEIQELRLAAILHDLGKLVNREEHARVGAKIAETWLCENIDSKHTIARITDVIAAHANKTGHEPDIMKAVLQDADVLDEIGAMSIMMTGNWVDETSPFFFDLLHERIVDFEIPYCDEKLQVLNTVGAKALLQERREFILDFASQLKQELVIDEEINDYLKTIE